MVFLLQIALPWMEHESAVRLKLVLLGEVSVCVFATLVSPIQTQLPHKRFSLRYNGVSTITAARQARLLHTIVLEITALQKKSLDSPLPFLDALAKQAFLVVAPRLQTRLGVEHHTMIQEV